MARTVTPLSDTKCEVAKLRDKDYTLFDGQRPFLLIKTTGTKTERAPLKECGSLKTTTLIKHWAQSLTEG